MDGALWKWFNPTDSVSAAEGLYVISISRKNLGTSGLIVAYRTAAAEAISAAEIVKLYKEEEVVYDFPYIMMNDVMKIIKEMSPRIVGQTYDNTCEIRLSIRASEAPILKEKLEKLSFKDD